MPTAKEKKALAGSDAPKNLDAYLRMNFLHQASSQLHAQENHNLARIYAGLIRLVAEKTVLRLYVQDHCEDEMLLPLLTAFTMLLELLRLKRAPVSSVILGCHLKIRFPLAQSVRNTVIPIFLPLQLTDIFSYFKAKDALFFSSNAKLVAWLLRESL